MVLDVVVPFLNERPVLGELLSTLEAQDRQPDHLVLVDDGSDDGSLQLAEAFASRHANTTVLQRPRRHETADRLASASELLAFRWAVEQLPAESDIVAKLDADLRLPPCALATMQHRLEDDASLGIAGMFLTEQGLDGTLRRITIGQGHVHGATKFYRRACFDEISPLPAILGWDTIDELRARRAGWRTASFALPGGDPLHLRPRGTRDGVLRAFRRWGVCAYAYGEPPVIAGLQSLRQMHQPPRVLAGLNYGLGYAGAALRRAPRAETELRASVRDEQFRRLRRRLAGKRR
jgi:glycosyltransferase involved in cell wall biosynthesis